MAKITVSLRPNSYTHYITSSRVSLLTLLRLFIQAVVDHINEGQRTFLELQRVIEIQDAIDGLPVCSSCSQTRAFSQSLVWFLTYLSLSLSHSLSAVLYCIAWSLVDTRVRPHVPSQSNQQGRARTRVLVVGYHFNRCTKGMLGIWNHGGSGILTLFSLHHGRNVTAPANRASPRSTTNYGSALINAA